jgi:hypothetical protein
MAHIIDGLAGSSIDNFNHAVVKLLAYFHDGHENMVSFSGA